MISLSSFSELADAFEQFVEVSAQVADETVGDVGSHRRVLLEQR